jgi:hypothetical protein
MRFEKVFSQNKVKREILISALTAVSVGIIIYQLVYNPIKFIEYLVYLFDLIVSAILIADFCLRMKESKEKKHNFILKHLSEGIKWNWQSLDSISIKAPLGGR